MLEVSTDGLALYRCTDNLRSLVNPIKVAPEKAFPLVPRVSLILIYCVCCLFGGMRGGGKGLRVNMKNKLI